MLIKDLPEKFKEMAFNNQIKQGNKPNENLSIDETKAKGNFTWTDTKEGFNFWHKIKEGYFPKEFLGESIKTINEYSIF